MTPSDCTTDPLYIAAVTVEQDETLGKEMAEWEAATLNNGLSEGTHLPPKDG